jgi:hypothetical protein
MAQTVIYTAMQTVETEVALTQPTPIYMTVVKEAAAPAPPPSLQALQEVPWYAWLLAGLVIALILVQLGGGRGSAGKAR